jgi:hypothetical protein
MPRSTPPRTDPTRPKHVPPRNPGNRPDPARPKHQPPMAPAGKAEGRSQKDDTHGVEQRDQDSEAPLTGRTHDDPRGTGEAASPDRDQDSEAPRTAIPPATR